MGVLLDQLFPDNLYLFFFIDVLKLLEYLHYEAFVFDEIYLADKFSNIQRQFSLFDFQVVVADRIIGVGIHVADHVPLELDPKVNFFAFFVAAFVPNFGDLGEKLDLVGQELIQDENQQQEDD